MGRSWQWFSSSIGLNSNTKNTKSDLNTPSRDIQINYQEPSPNLPPYQIIPRHTLEHAPPGRPHSPDQCRPISGELQDPERSCTLSENPRCPRRPSRAISQSHLACTITSFNNPKATTSPGAVSTPARHVLAPLPPHPPPPLLPSHVQPRREHRPTLSLRIRTTHPRPHRQ